MNSESKAGRPRKEITVDDVVRVSKGTKGRLKYLKTIFDAQNFDVIIRKMLDKTEDELEKEAKKSSNKG